MAKKEDETGKVIFRAVAGGTISLENGMSFQSTKREDKQCYFLADASQADAVRNDPGYKRGAFSEVDKIDPAVEAMIFRIFSKEKIAKIFSLPNANKVIEILNVNADNMIDRFESTNDTDYAKTSGTSRVGDINPDEKYEDMSFDEIRAEALKREISFTPEQDNIEQLKAILIANDKGEDLNDMYADYDVKGLKALIDARNEKLADADKIKYAGNASRAKLLELLKEDDKK
ncbi:hypothetical protein BH10BAC5_BH10BAC5_17000 [soil metagenome]